MVSYNQEGKRGIFYIFSLSNVRCFSFILSQFFLALTKFIEKYIDIYNTKHILQYIQWNKFGLVDTSAFFYKLGQW
jgi:hypothetical protein